MLSDQEFYRVDATELRDLIVRKIGKQRAKSYFDQLRKFFSYRISKREFDKFCVRVLGRENVPLHNRLIRTILTNACVAKVPPSRGFSKAGSKLNGKSAVGFQADACPPSPGKARFSANMDNRIQDGPSPLTDSLGRPQSIVCEEMVSKLPEQQIATELHSLGSRPPVENASVEDGEEVEQLALSPGIQSRSHLTAPFGVSMKPCGARKGISNSLVSLKNQMETCQTTGELPDTKSLRCRLEQKLEVEGLKVSTDCVNLLNISLDAYLKRLIAPCVERTRSRSGNSRQAQIKRPSMPTLYDASLGRHMQGLHTSVNASMLDFRTAIELNPRILGVDWAMQFEKICSRPFEE